MDILKQKIKLIYIPLLLITLPFIVGYTFINWLFLIKLNLFDIDQDVVNFWLPLVLPLIPILIWLRPRISLLKLNKKAGGMLVFYHLIALMAVAVPTMVAQAYLEKATGNFQQLDSVHQINTRKLTKYYQIKDFYLDKQNISSYVTFDTTTIKKTYSHRYRSLNKQINKNKKSKTDMQVYILLPFLASPKDTLSSYCATWLGIQFSKELDKKLSEEQMQESYQNFVLEIKKNLDSEKQLQFVYLERLENSQDSRNFATAAAENKKYKAATINILVSQNEPFANRTDGFLAWIFFSFFFLTSAWLVMVLIPKFEETELTEM